MGSDKCATLVDNERITAQYNGWRKNKLLVFMDEALYGGRRKDLGVLKAMITEPTFDLNEKYQPAVQYPCYMRVLGASNNFSTNHVATDERRWLNLRVGDSLRCNHEFFGALWDELNDGGLEWLMAQCIWAYNNNGINPRALPRSEHGRELKLDCISRIQKWWLAWLQEERVDAMGHEISLREWSVNMAYADYKETSDGDYGRAGSKIWFVREWRKQCLPEVCKTERRLVDGRRIRFMQLLPIAQLRHHFAVNVLSEKTEDVFVSDN